MVLWKQRACRWGRRADCRLPQPNGNVDAHAEREIGVFIERYNQEWLVERHDHCTPRAIRAKLEAAA